MDPSRSVEAYPSLATRANEMSLASVEIRTRSVLSARNLRTIRDHARCNWPRSNHRVLLDFATRNRQVRRKVFTSRWIRTAKRVRMFAPTPTPKPIAFLILKDQWRSSQSRERGMTNFKWLKTSLTVSANCSIVGYTDLSWNATINPSSSSDEEILRDRQRIGPILLTRCIDMIDGEMFCNRNHFIKREEMMELCCR